MKDKTITLYDSHYSLEKDAGTREWLFELYAENEGWKTPDDIPEKYIMSEIYEQSIDEWEVFVDDLESFVENEHFILTGYCDTWHGKLPCGTFINSFDELLDAISSYDDIRVTDRNGHLIIECSHHDGTNRYELKRLTNKGYLLADNNSFAHDRKLHDIIINNNFYSVLPHFAKRIYGL